MQDISIQSDLALLSLHVAREVDRKLGGAQLNEGVLREFSDKLAKASGIGEASSEAFLLSDPVTTEVLAEVVNRMSPQPLPDLAALKDALMYLVSPLSKNAGTISETELSKLKAFCLSLHKSMVAQQLPNAYDRDNAFDEEVCSV